MIEKATCFSSRKPEKHCTLMISSNLKPNWGVFKLFIILNKSLKWFTTVGI